MISGRMLFSRSRYYLASLPTLMMGFQRPISVAVFCLGAGKSRRGEVVLRDGSRYLVRGALDVWIVKETNLDRQYEQFGFELEENWIVVDIGAGIGDFAVRAARRCQRGRVVAVEPASDSFRLLERNIALNRVDNVETHRLAIGNSSGEVVVETALPPAARRIADATIDDSSEPVAAVTLTQLFDLAAVDRCDLLKVDCEGCEYALLRGAGGSAFDRVRRIALEYHERFGGASPPELVSLLRRHGFATIHRVPNPVYRDLGMIYAER